MKNRSTSIDGKEAANLHLSLLHNIPPPSPLVGRSSLIRMDELHASSGDKTLHSLSVTSGDLPLYSLLSEGSRNPWSPDSEKDESDGDSESPGLGSDSPRPDDDSGPSVREIDLIDKDSVALDAQEVMDLDEVGDADECRKFSEPYFLRKVLMRELRGNKEDVNHRMLALAVHAVMLEYGFVAIDPATKMTTDGFHLPEQWHGIPAYFASLNYSFPEIPLGRGSIFLRFQTLGRFMNVDGRLNNGKEDMPRVSLDGSVLLPKIASVLSNCDYNAAKGVLEFWKLVKDSLVLPLSINLSERAGLVLPSCFASLPMELKAKILDSLTGIDLAKVACVCSELHDLSKNSDLWKRKCVEEFGYQDVACYGRAMRAEIPDWKREFRQRWIVKRIKIDFLAWPRTPKKRLLPSFNRIRRDPRPLPVLRDLSRRGVNRRIPRCNLGGTAGSQ